MENSKSVLEMSSQEAEVFFLKDESYHNIPLPSYFSFSNLLDKLNKLIDKYKNNLNDFFNIYEAMKKYDVNYTIYGNKDGKLSYRPLQLIHPLIYVSLVKEITQKKKIGRN